MKVMGVWKNLFGKGGDHGNPEKKDVGWIALDSRDQLDQISSRSGKKTQLIYKHSVSCGISAMVLKLLEGKLAKYGQKADYYFLDILRNREVSDAVSRKYGIRHESPQLLIIENGKLKASASHGAIADMEFE
jgi:bacillithiol system protein YtxJ